MYIHDKYPTYVGDVNPVYVSMHSNGSCATTLTNPNHTTTNKPTRASSAWSNSRRTNPCDTPPTTPG
ncbi:hypothetical protein Rctr71_027 [Virus Rctr71]|nr:hypothetical protein Rctr71_027 [Virus Rctr71]